MNNKTTQKLIVLFGAIIFSLALTNSVSASSDCVIRDFKANGMTSITINSGDLVTLSWNANNCKSIKLSGRDVSTEVSSSDYFNVNPTVSSNYTILATATGFYPYQYQTVKVNVIPKAEDTSVNGTVNPNQYNYFYNKATSTTTEKDVTPKVSKTESTDKKVETPAKDNSNDLTALSLRGSGGFMPSSIWQWILLVILILIIIIVGRMFVHKPDPSDPAHH
jgi:hypothetical protein